MFLEMTMIFKFVFFYLVFWRQMIAMRMGFYQEIGVVIIPVVQAHKNGMEVRKYANNIWRMMNQSNMDSVGYFLVSSHRVSCLELLRFYLYI